ncbi:hypothetical protein EON79_19140 [bacterium]|nr:MAG: hypothetical protein EON79_19140 [bacterium]
MNLQIDSSDNMIVEPYLHDSTLESVQRTAEGLALRFKGADGEEASLDFPGRDIHLWAEGVVFPVTVSTAYFWESSQEKQIDNVLGSVVATRFRKTLASYQKSGWLLLATTNHGDPFVVFGPASAMPEVSEWVAE